MFKMPPTTEQEAMNRLKRLSAFVVPFAINPFFVATTATSFFAAATLRTRSTATSLFLTSQEREFMQQVLDTVKERQNRQREKLEKARRHYHRRQRERAMQHLLWSSNNYMGGGSNCTTATTNVLDISHNENTTSGGQIFFGMTKSNAKHNLVRHNGSNNKRENDKQHVDTEHLPLWLQQQRALEEKVRRMNQIQKQAKLNITASDSVYHYTGPRSSYNLVKSPPAVTTVGDAKAAYHESTENAAVPPGILTIGDAKAAYAARNGIDAMPPTVKTIGDAKAAFAAKNGNAAMPADITTIGDAKAAYAARNGDTALPPVVKTIGDVKAAYKATTGNTAVPPDVKTIGDAKAANRAEKDAKPLTIFKLDRKVLLQPTTKDRATTIVPPAASLLMNRKRGPSLIRSSKSDGPRTDATRPAPTPRQIETFTVSRGNNPDSKVQLNSTIWTATYSDLQERYNCSYGAHNTTTLP